jgi:hypothetical protein
MTPDDNKGCCVFLAPIAVGVLISRLEDGKNLELIASVLFLFSIGLRLSMPDLGN